ncbi:hypothetical protein [Actinophytocola sp.]|uniref:hypothetical protein n=1 Tax=Actinophytocola sp. TaxID=1872138 RepID=UPI002ED1B280
MSGVVKDAFLALAVVKDAFPARLPADVATAGDVRRVHRTTPRATKTIGGSGFNDMNASFRTSPVA